MPDQDEIPAESDAPSDSELADAAEPVADGAGVPETAAPPQKLGRRERRHMRDRLRELEAARHELLLDLGSLVHELQRHGRREPRLLLPKAAELAEVDGELRELARRAGDPRHQPIEQTCSACGASCEPGQLVCLRCGARFEFDEVKPRRSTGGNGAALGIVLLAIAVAGGGVLGFTFFDKSSDGSGKQVSQRAAASQSELQLGGSRTSTSTESVPQASPSAPSDSATAKTPIATKAPKAAGDDLVKDGALYTWPRALRGYTVVLTSNGDRASAERYAASAAREAQDGQFGVVRSNDFSSLPQNFYIVFAGRYDSSAAAEKAAMQLRSQFGSAFAQLVSP